MSGLSRQPPTSQYLIDSHKSLMFIYQYFDIWLFITRMVDEWLQRPMIYEQFKYFHDIFSRFCQKASLSPAEHNRYHGNFCFKTFRHSEHFNNYSLLRQCISLHGIRTGTGQTTGMHYRQGVGGNDWASRNATSESARLVLNTRHMRTCARSIILILLLLLYRIVEIRVDFWEKACKRRERRKRVMLRLCSMR